MLELTGTSYPTQHKGKNIHALIGKSMLPVLSGTATDVHPDDGMGYELFEMKAYIKGNWKILRQPIPFGTGQWQLFDLGKDPGETTDLAAANPEVTAQLVKAWNEYATTNEVYDHHGHYDSVYKAGYAPKEKQ